MLNKSLLLSGTAASLRNPEKFAKIALGTYLQVQQYHSFKYKL